MFLKTILHWPKFIIHNKQLFYSFRANIPSFDGTGSRCLGEKNLNILLKGFLVSQKDFFHWPTLFPEYLCLKEKKEGKGGEEEGGGREEKRTEKKLYFFERSR